MNWGYYYRLFGNLNALFSKTIEIYDTITFKQANSSDIKHSTKELLDKAKGEFEALKRFYFITKAENQNPYALINLELAKILPTFRNDEFYFVIEGNKSDKKVQTLLRYNLTDFKEGLEKQELNDVDGIEVILYYIYAYTKYWSWLQDQKPVYTYVEYIRSFEVNLDGTRYEEMNKEELFIGLILEQYAKPNQAFQEVTLFLDSLESETHRKTLLYYVRDRVYSLYQLEGIREAMNSKHKNSSKEALQAFYTAFMELLNSVYNVSERPSIDAPKEIAPPPSNSPTLIWNGNKNTLIDIFYQLKMMTTKKGGSYLPILDNTNEEIADFLKANFAVFKSTTTKTIETTLSRADLRPKKSTGKISLIEGFMDK